MQRVKDPLNMLAAYWPFVVFNKWNETRRVARRASTLPKIKFDFDATWRVRCERGLRVDFWEEQLASFSTR